MDNRKPGKAAVIDPAGRRARAAMMNPWATVGAAETEIAETNQTALALYGPPAELVPLARLDDDPGNTALACADDLEPQDPEQIETSRAGGWTIGMLCIGLGILAACMIIPQADSNRRLVYERQQLKLDLAQIQKQIEVNKRFLADIASDPQLAERLAVRQMKVVPQGERVLELGSETDQGAATTGLAGDQAEQMSPFGMLTVPPPPALPPYRPLDGVLAALCRDPQTRLMLMAIALFMVAAGLILGTGAEQAEKVRTPAP